jgi:hypothetical protein
MLRAQADPFGQSTHQGSFIFTTRMAMAFSSGGRVGNIAIVDGTACDYQPRTT